MSNRLLWCVCATMSGMGVIGYVLGNLDGKRDVVKLRPVVILSASSGASGIDQRLLWRAAISNDTIIMIGDSNQLKVDFIYGNYDGVEQLDFNKR